jgi:hypothetical protein
MKPVRRFLKPIFDYIAEIQVVKYPLFIVFGNTDYKVKAEETREVLSLIRPGDLILRRFNNRVTNIPIPGYFSHVAIVEDRGNVIHAVSDGVIRTDILDYVRTDSLAIVRPKTEAHSTKCVVLAREAIGKPYDYIFDSDDRRAFYCSELAMHCLPDIVPKRQQVRDKVPPNKLMELEDVDIIFDSREWRKSQEKK